MYGHKKCRYVCGFIPHLDLDTANLQIKFEKSNRNQDFIRKLCFYGWVEHIFLSWFLSFIPLSVPYIFAV